VPRWSVENRVEIVLRETVADHKNIPSDAEFDIGGALVAW
jgi:hypothetical protein